MPEFCEHPINLWEWACSRRGRQIQHGYRLTGRFREQARSHNVFTICLNFVGSRQTCGSGLAHEEAGRFNMDIA
ncbi:hypothetical protein E4T63_11720 [Pseudomonas fluorescens]|uniref:Uncharacterized protein n=1 Tax=Pseudomonas fluorescens TaxID=294 RepID=A0AAP9CIJ6_PSEFL|nr:hypothetical protein E4T63_11720 [Pseudomonas fluorescens]